MAKIIVACRFKKSAKGVGNLIRYMGTREGVEKLPSTKEYEIASRNQINLIQSVAEHFPNSKKFLEYEDFYAEYESEYMDDEGYDEEYDDDEEQGWGMSM